jgi:hypothetical protein
MASYQVLFGMLSASIQAEEIGILNISGTSKVETAVHADSKMVCIVVHNFAANE